MTHWRLPQLSLLFGMLLGLLAGCAAEQNCALVPLASMPMELHNNLMLVTLGINDKPARLLVDTGAERTVLTEAAVRRLGLGRDTHQTASSGITGFSVSRDARVPGIVLGGTRFPVESVAVGRFRLPNVAGRPVDGMLGADILLAFELDLDIPDRQLTLYRLRRCPIALPPWPAIDVSGVTPRRDRMLVPITVDGVSGSALLDTGSQISGISAAMARRAGVTQAMLAKDPAINLIVAAPGTPRVPMHRFHSVTVAGEPKLYPRLAVLPNSTGLGDGVVGVDFIRSRRVWLVFPTGHLFIAEGADPERPRSQIRHSPRHFDQSRPG